MRNVDFFFVVPDLGLGGSQRVIYNLACELAKRKFSVQITVLCGSNQYFDFSDVDIDLVYVGKTKVRYSLLKLLSLANKASPKVVFSSLGYINLSLLFFRKMKLLKIPGRLWIREANVLEPRLDAARLGIALNWLYRWLYPTSDIVFYSSAFMREEAARYYSISPSKIKILNNPVDVRGVKDLASTEVSVFNHPLNLLVVGRLVPQKGIDRLLLALEASGRSDIGLTVIGEGRCKDELQHLVRELQLEQNVRFIGSQTNPYPWILHADMLIVSSRWEGMPNVALEGLCLGTPVLCSSETGALSELIGHGCNGLITYNSFHEIVFALKTLESLHASKKVNEVRLPRQFYSEQVVDDFVRYLNQ